MADIGISPALGSRPGHRGVSLGLTMLLMCLANAWALQYAFAKGMAQADLPVLASLLAVHVMVVAVLAVALALRRELFAWTWRRIGFFALAAILGNVITQWSEISAAEHIPAGTLTLALSTTPVFVVALSILLRSEALTVRKTLAIALGSGAAMSLLIPDASAGDPAWVLIAFLAPLSFAAMAVLLWVAWPKRLSPLQVAFGCAAASLVILAPLAMAEGKAGAILLAVRSESGLLLVGFATMLIAEYWLFAVITRRGGAVYASCADFAAVAFGLFWAFAIFSEVPSGWMWVAAGLAIASNFLIAPHMPAAAEAGHGTARNPAEP